MNPVVAVLLSTNVPIIRPYRTVRTRLSLGCPPLRVKVDRPYTVIIVKSTTTTSAPTTRLFLPPTTHQNKNTLALESLVSLRSLLLDRPLTKRLTVLEPVDLALVTSIRAGDVAGILFFFGLSGTNNNLVNSVVVVNIAGTTTRN